MAGEEFMKIKRKGLLRRMRIFRIVVYVAAAISLGSFAFAIIDWHGFSWILIGATYALLAVNFVLQIRMISKELRRREVKRSTDIAP